MPEDESLCDDLGTYLLVSKDPSIEKIRSTHYPWEKFNIIKKTEYLPNTFVLCAS